MTYLLEFLQTIYYLFIDMSYYLFIGLIFVGLLHIYMSDEFVSKHLGANSLWSVIKASLFGVPLPLCSCGVIPTGLQLKKSGASNGSVISFLTSTPQTGIDSMIATFCIENKFTLLHNDKDFEPFVKHLKLKVYNK